jgi:hypothetical protein
MRNELDDAAVAALFFEFTQLPACPPHDRMPPEDRGRRELEEPDEIVAAPDMDEFVGDDCGLGFATQPGKEFGRQNRNASPKPFGLSWRAVGLEP